MSETWLKTGVYAIRNRKNGKLYVGSTTKSLSGRIHSHRKGLNSGTHVNKYLQRAWDKYGSKSFVFMILERCPKDMCLIREQYWINKFDSANPQFGYNLSPTAGSVFGLKHSKESKKRHSLRAHRQYEDPEFRSKRSASAKEAMADPKVREKISITLTGRKLSPETCKKMSTKQSLRYEDPEAHRITSEAAKRQWADPVIRERMIAAMKLGKQQLKREGVMV